MKEESKMTAEELIERFAKDIIYDCHSLRARFERSMAMRELVRRGPAVLGAISKFLKTPIAEREAGDDLDWAFCSLLNQIGVHHLKKELKEAPDSQDVDGWASWAEKYKAA
jgi:hypothetical protein